MTEQTDAPSIITQNSALALPQQFVAPPPDEAGELRMIRRSQWETVKRCVGRIKPDSSFGASWTSFLGGVSVSGLIGLITVRYTIASRTVPDNAAQSFLFWMTVFALLSTVLAYGLERHERGGRADHLTALQDEINALDSYMTKPKA